MFHQWWTLHFLLVRSLAHVGASCCSLSNTFFAPNKTKCQGSHYIARWDWTCHSQSTKHYCGRITCLSKLSAVGYYPLSGAEHQTVAQWGGLLYPWGICGSNRAAHGPHANQNLGLPCAKESDDIRLAFLATLIDWSQEATCEQKNILPTDACPRCVTMRWKIAITFSSPARLLAGSGDPLASTQASSTSLTSSAQRCRVVCPTPFALSFCSLYFGKIGTQGTRRSSKL